jgi:hypothetical protein
MQMITISSLRIRIIMLIAVVALPLVGYAFLNALQVEKRAVTQARTSLQGLLDLAAVKQDHKVESVRQVRWLSR